MEQSSPAAVTSEGIFEITQDATVKTKYTLKYEVVQTTPSIGATAPTATAGFGSSSGGTLGTMNVQTFVNIVMKLLLVEGSEYKCLAHYVLAFLISLQ